MENLFSEIEEDKGFSAVKLQNAEIRLGIKFPEQFRHFYLTQGRNAILNQHLKVKEPQHLEITQDEWVEFYVEQQGVCEWAININDFAKKEQAIYIKHDGCEFEKEAKNLFDFLIIRAAGDYSKHVYPYIIYGDEITDFDEVKIKKILGEPKSDVNTTQYFHVKLFWIKPEFVVRTVKYSNDRGFVIVVYSKEKKEILEFINFISSVGWVVKKGEILKKEIALIKRKNQTTFNTTNTDDDLPF